MKQLLMGLMLLMSAGAASAEWTLVGESHCSGQYIDRATCRTTDNIASMLFRR